MSYDDLERLRLADADFGLELSQQLAVESGAIPDLVGVVSTDGSFPTAAGRFFKIVPQLVLGTPIEGQTGTFTNLGTGAIYALNLGSGVPTSGTSRVVCSWVNNRWVFEF